MPYDPFLSPSLPSSLSLPLPPSVSLCLPPSLPLFPSFSLFLLPSLSLSLPPLLLSPSLPPLSLSPSLPLSLHPSLSLPQRLIHLNAGYLFVPLATQMMNDSSPYCRQMAAESIKALLQRVSHHHVMRC